MADTDLVAAAVAGDEVAFGTLLGACRHRAWSVCFRICGNREDAADALQDAVISAWRHLPSFQGTARFSTWFYRIAANASLQLVRRRREEVHGEMPDVPARGDFTEDVVRTSVLQAALLQLRPDHRTVLVLREWGDLTYEEIAAWQGVPVQTVKTRLNRARHALRALLEDG